MCHNGPFFKNIGATGQFDRSMGVWMCVWMCVLIDLFFEATTAPHPPITPQWHRWKPMCFHTVSVPTIAERRMILYFSCYDTFTNFLFPALWIYLKKTKVCNKDGGLCLPHCVFLSLLLSLFWFKLSPGVWHSDWFEGGSWLVCFTPTKPTNSCSFLKAPLTPHPQHPVPADPFCFQPIQPFLLPTSLCCSPCTLIVLQNQDRISHSLLYGVIICCTKQKKKENGDQLLL